MKTLTDVLESSMTSLYESIFDTIDDEGNITTDSSELIKQDIINWIKENYHDLSNKRCLKIRNEYTKDKKYIVDADCHVYVSSFDIHSNDKIKSLTNGQFVWGKVKSFYCGDCRFLTSLEGAPKEVSDTFNCSDCDSLTSLKDGPEKVGKDFYCNDCNNLKSLKGAPKEVDGDFNCYSCKSLESLKGAPEKVGRDFCCNDCNKLTSLKGSPKEIGRDFWCVECNKLTSLEGGPEKIGRDFWCVECNKLTSLEGVPKEVKRNFNCDVYTDNGKNKKTFTKKDIKQISKVNKDILVK